MSISAIEQMAEHKGACNAVLAAMRLLRSRGYRDAADILLENVSAITEPDECVIPPEPDETPDPLPVLPDSWPFPTRKE